MLANHIKVCPRVQSQASNENIYLLAAHRRPSPKKPPVIYNGRAYLLQAIGFGVFLLNQTIPVIYVWFILYGIGMGTGFVFATMAAHYFGRKAFGSIQGSRMMFMAPFSMASPIYAGWVYDTTGSYITVFAIFAAALAVAAVLMSLTLPPKPPAQVTDIRKIV